MLNKCFNRQQMLNFVPVFNELAERIMDQVCQEITTEDFYGIVNKNFLNNFYGMFITGLINRSSVSNLSISGYPLRECWLLVVRFI